jgi:hypothetical protein
MVIVPAVLCVDVINEPVKAGSDWRLSGLRKEIPSIVFTP